MLRVALFLDAHSAFTEHDPNGLGVTIIAMSVVLLALLILSLIFKSLGPALSRARRLREGSAVGSSGASSSGVKHIGTDADEAVIAAISLALHEHFEAMRNDDIISLSIQEISRRYSPWGDKREGVQVNQLERITRTNRR